MKTGTKKPKLLEFPVKQVRVGARVRNAVGSLAELQASIERIGLLHPIVLRSDHRLVSGLRRLQAFKRLGRTAIPALVADGFEDTIRHLRAENDENVCREPFTPEEMVTMAGKLRPGIAAEAKERELSGKGPGGSGGRGRKKPCGKLPQGLARSRDQIAKAVGVSGRTLDKAEAVVESGDEKLIAEMNRTKRVSGVHIALAAFRGPPTPNGRRSSSTRHESDGKAAPPIPCSEFRRDMRHPAADRPGRATRTPRFGRDARRCGRITLVDRPNPPRLPA